MYSKDSTKYLSSHFPRLSLPSIWRRGIGFEQRHSFRYIGDVLLSPGPGIRHWQNEAHYRVPSRWKLVSYVHSQVPRSVLWTGAANRQWIFDWIFQCHLSRPGYLSVLRWIRVPDRKANRKDFLYGRWKMGEEAVLFG